MDVKRELEEMEAELRALLPEIAQERPDHISKMAATALASRYDREGRPPSVPCPVCGEILQVGRIEIDDGEGGIKGAVWIDCKKRCTTAVLDYGL
jgi:hypothetical protein